MIPAKKDVVMASRGPHRYDPVLRDQRLQWLIDRLPGYLQPVMRWLRRPSSRWVRVPAGAFLIGAGMLGFLPVFGFWMLPLGLALLAQDFPPARWVAARLLDWIERRSPQLLRKTSQ